MIVDSGSFCLEENKYLSCLNSMTLISLAAIRTITEIVINSIPSYTACLESSDLMMAITIFHQD